MSFFSVVLAIVFGLVGLWLIFALFSWISALAGHTAAAISCEASEGGGGFFKVLLGIGAVLFLVRSCL